MVFVPTWNCKYFHFFLLIILIILIISNTTILAQSSNQTNTDIQESSLSNSLTTLYKLSQNFIYAISGNGIREVIEEVFRFNFTNPSSFSSINFNSIDFNLFAQKMAKSSAGYIVIIAIGIIFILFFLSSCFSLFCCRKLGCCCGRVAGGEVKSSDVPVVAMLFALMVAVSVMMTLSSYGSIASGISAVDSLKEDEQSGIPFVGNLLPVIRKLPDFIKKAVQDVENQLNDELVDRFFGNFSEVLQKFIDDQISKCEACSNLLSDLKLLASYASNISSLIDNMDVVQRNLLHEYSNYSRSLDAFKNVTLQALGSNCTETNPCDFLKWNVSNLYLLRNDSIQFVNFSSIKSELENFKKFENNTAGNLTAITDSINNVTKDFLQMLRNQSDKLKQLLNQYNIYDLDNQYLNINSSLLSGLPWPTIKQVANIIPTALKAGAIVIGSIFFLIIILNVIGLILGPTCIKRSPKSSERVFLASTQISFLFGAIFCIIAILVFIIGAPVYREFCFDVKKESDSYYFKAIDLVLQQELNKTNFSSFGNFKVKFEPKKLFLLTKTIEKECKNNESLVNVIFDVITVDNETVNGVLNMTTPTIKEALNEFNLSKLPIFSDDVIEGINNSLTSINNYEFNAPFNLTQLLSIRLDIIERLMNDSLNENINNKTQMHELATRTLPNLIARAGNITTQEKILLEELKQLKNILLNTSDHLLKILNETYLARNQINNISSNSILEDLTNELRKTFWDFYDYLKQKLSEVARCREVYDIFNLIFIFVCDRVVNPLNAYWFALGISIVLLIPSFTFGLWIGGLFARRHKSLEDNEGSEEGGDEFVNVKSSDYLKQEESRYPQTSQVPSRPQVPAAGGAFGYQQPNESSPSSSLGQYSPTPDSPNSNSLENASIYYIPSFNQQPSPARLNPSKDPYYNMPYFRVSQRYPRVPFSGPEIRIPRPWRPRSNNGFIFPPYSRF